MAYNLWHLSFVQVVLQRVWFTMIRWFLRGRKYRYKYSNMEKKAREKERETRKKNNHAFGGRFKGAIQCFAFIQCLVIIGQFRYFQDMSIRNRIKRTNKGSLSKRKRETIHKHTNSLLSEICLRYQQRLIKEPSIQRRYFVNLRCCK